jgi:hypothetical protein
LNAMREKRTKKWKASNNFMKKNYIEDLIRTILFMVKTH